MAHVVKDSLPSEDLHGFPHGAASSSSAVGQDHELGGVGQGGKADFCVDRVGVHKASRGGFLHAWDRHTVTKLRNPTYANSGDSPLIAALNCGPTNKNPEHK